MSRPAAAWQCALVLAGMAALHGAASADVLLEYESPTFTKMVIANDHPSAAARLRRLDRAPGPVRVRIRLADERVGADGEFGNNNYLPDGHTGILAVEIAAGELRFEYANRQQRVEFSGKLYRGQVVQWQLLGSSPGGREEITVLGPGRTRTGSGMNIEGAAQCPALDIVREPGMVLWYCGTGTWKISRIAAGAALPPLVPPLVPPVSR